MAKFQIPERLQEIAAELNANIREETDDLEEVVAFLQFRLDSKRFDVNQPLDAIEVELDDFALIAAIVEGSDDNA